MAKLKKSLVRTPSKRVKKQATRASASRAKPVKPRPIKKKAPLRPKKSLKKSALRSTRIRLIHYEKNPIIAPSQENVWEAWQTFNPGVILLNNKVHFLYRAIGPDGLSRLGYAVSGDGFHIDERFPSPVYEHLLQSDNSDHYFYPSGGSWGGCEDPRIVQVDDEDVLYMTYTACDGGLRVALTSIKLNDFLHKRWNWAPPVMLSPRNETHKNWVLLPKKINGKYGILHSITPKISLAYLDDLRTGNGLPIQSAYYNVARKGGWEECLRGVGPSPIETKHGWLVLYHAVQKKDPGKYKVGAMLLDLHDPTRVLAYAKEPILEPLKIHDGIGFKPGIVYASGAVAKNGLLLVYFGRADSYIGVAYAPLDEFVDALMQGRELKIQSKKVVGV